MKYDLYPSLSFQTSGFILSSNLSEPFEQWKASIGPVLNLPIWNPRKNRNSAWFQLKTRFLKKNGEHRSI